MIKLCMLLTALCAANLGFSKDKANYSAAATAGDFIYVSGQYPVDLRTGVMVNGDIETLTDQVIDNMKHVLKANGADLKDVISTTVYLTDIRDYSAMDEAYGKSFKSKYPPTRNVVAVSELAYNARIQISCVAYKKQH